MRTLLLFLIFLTGIPGDARARELPAFPGAMGAGALSQGGRGGQVIPVTNLKDSGHGSLRSALEARGRRIVVFRVAGTIELRSRIRISNPYLTIAGQTAPGGGILLSGKRLPARSSILISLEDVNDVVIRYLRFRYGWTRLGEQQGRCLNIGDGVRRVIVDHCSFSWAADENVTLWASEQPYGEVTFSYNISAEGLEDHSCGLIAGGDVEVSDRIMDIDFHHNLFLHNANRNPLFKGKRSRVVSNLVYNPNWWAMACEGGAEIDFISNAFLTGPAGSSGHREILYREDDDAGPQGNPSIHVSGNTGPGKADPEAGDWPLVAMVTSWKRPGVDVPQSVRRGKPLAPSGVPIVPTPAPALKRALSASNGAGACRRLDSLGRWVDARDAVDRRLLSELAEGRGLIPHHESQVGGFPRILPGSPFPDEDRDGMADPWEVKHGFNPASSTDGNRDRDGDGYHNIEEFLNGTDPGTPEGSTAGSS